jgi:aerobic carbon-monoxide dehydrogenase medium subunit
MESHPLREGGWAEVIPTAFDYEVADSADHAIQLLQQHGEDAKLLAGGHSLIPLMRLRLARPTVLIDIDRITDLSYVRDDGDRIEIGALARMGDLTRDPLLTQGCGLLAHTCGLVGDPQVRHRATIGGSVAHGDSASDPPTTLLALEAEFVIRGTGGERTVPASGFFRSLFETDVGPDEILTAIRVPKLGPGTGWSYQKFHRRAIDWAIVGVAAVVERSNGSVSQGRVGLTNMGMTPLRASGVEAALAGGESSPEALAAAAEHAPEGTRPPSDANASAEYRSELSKVLVRRALQEAVAG